MKPLQNLSKKAMIAMMIAATGLPASIAAAQFKVEYSAKDNAESKEVREIEIHATHDEKDEKKGDKKESTTKSVTVYKVHDDDDQVIEVKIVNGEVVHAMHDGKNVVADQVKVKDDVIVIMDEDGKMLYEIKVPKASTFPSAPAAPHAPIATTNKNHFVWSSKSGEQPNVDFHIARTKLPGTVQNNQVTVFDAQQPKVMLGINLGEPSPILRKHLNLKDGMSAILVERVIDGLPAAIAGIEDFDVIVSIDGSEQADGEILRKVLADKEIGDQMKVVVMRGGDKMKFKVKLAEYDGEALGSITYIEESEANGDLKNNLFPEGFEFEFLTEGEMNEEHEHEMNRLKDQLLAQRNHSKALGIEAENRRFIVEQMQEKAMNAMKGAERQLLELHDGTLIVRDLEKHLGTVTEQIHEHLGNMNPEAIHNHMDQMDDRLSALEDRLDEQVERMSEQMDRLAEMFERLMERMEED